MHQAGCMAIFMKAAVLYKNKDIRCDEYKTPETRPGTVKVRVRVSGICGSDVPRVLQNGAHFYPVVLGHEFSGDVAEVGEGVTTLSVGDRVSGVPLVPCMSCEDCQRGNFALCKHYSFIGSREQGSFAQYVVLPASNAVKYDPVISYEQAAMFEPSTVALHGVLQNEYRGGGVVGVLGCGTIGIFTVQWAKLLGAKSVVALDIDRGRLELAKRMGADVALDTTAPDFEGQLKAATGGRGFDYLFEAAGSTVTMRLAFSIAGNGARLCFIGTPHEPLTFTQKEWECMNRKEFSLTGSWMSYSAPFPGKEWLWTAHYFATGQLKFDPAFIFKTFPLSQVDKAFALFNTPAQVHGKVLLSMPEET